MTSVERPMGVLAAGPVSEEREERLDAGATKLAAGRSAGSWVLNERVLVAGAGALMTAGVTAIILGWVGASRSIVVAKQMPYLISGGLLGLALATIGGTMFFTHWVAALLRQSRWQHAEQIRILQQEREKDRDALASAIADLRRGVRVDGTAGGREHQRPIRRAPRSS